MVLKADFEKTREENTVAHRVHRFNKEKTTQIKRILANIKYTLKTTSPLHWKPKLKLHKKYAHCKQNSCTLYKPKRNFKKIGTLQSKRNTRCKQNFSTLQTRKKLLKNNCTLQTKELHAANCKQIKSKSTARRMT